METIGKLETGSPPYAVAQSAKAGVWSTACVGDQAGAKVLQRA